MPYISSLSEKVKKIDELEKKLNELIVKKEENDKKEKEEIQKENRYFKNSNIIKLEDENKILNLFENYPKRFKLLLDSKIDGDLTKTFFDKCGNIYPTITFIKTTEGKIFAGYTSRLWTYNGFTKDNKAFIFSFNDNLKYDIYKPEKATYYNENSFRFGSQDIEISNNCTTNTNSYLRSGSYIYDDQSYKYYINNYYLYNNGMSGGSDNSVYFKVDSYEVYQPIY